MPLPAIAISVLAITLAVAFLLLLVIHLSFSLLRRRTHPPYPLETPSLSMANLSNLSPAKLSPLYSHGVLSAPKRFLLSSPMLDAMLQPPSHSTNATESFVCISNPVFDSVINGSNTMLEEDASRSPELKLMKKLPVKAKPAPRGCLVNVPRSLETSVSAMETNRASFSSEDLCSSPSW